MASKDDHGRLHTQTFMLAKQAWQDNVMAEVTGCTNSVAELSAELNSAYHRFSNSAKPSAELGSIAELEPKLDLRGDSNTKFIRDRTESPKFSKFSSAVRACVLGCWCC